MKKGLMICIAILMILASLFPLVVADDLIMGGSFSAEGVGVVDISLQVASEGRGQVGIKLNEELYTPSLGLKGLTPMSYNSGFELGMYNVSDNTTTDFEYTSSSIIANSKRSVYISNYIVGAAMGFASEGDTDQTVNIYTEDSMMEADVSGLVEGEITFFQKVVDVNAIRTVRVQEKSELIGKYNYNWTRYVESVVYPEADITNDWLGCP